MGLCRELEVGMLEARGGGEGRRQHTERGFENRNHIHSHIISAGQKKAPSQMTRADEEAGVRRVIGSGIEHIFLLMFWRSVTRQNGGQSVWRRLVVEPQTQ